jgi:putative transcriptional regulator
MTASPSVRDSVLARRIAGEIILSSRPGATMRKWRELFAVSQMRLSDKMLVSSSVISDYESGRRPSPGTRFVRRFVWALVKIDEERGGRFIHEFAKLTSSPSNAIVDLREFPIPVRVEYLCRTLDGKIVAGLDRYVKEVNGYTVVDSKKAVETLSGLEFSQLFGATTERVLIFTNIESGFSPMLMVRISNLKPRVVVFHGAEPDGYSIRLAEYDGIPLLVSSLPSLEQLVKSLRRLYRIALHRKLGKPVRPPPQVTE